MLGALWTTGRSRACSARCCDVRYQIVRRAGEPGAELRHFSVEGAGTEWTSFAMPFAPGEVSPGETLIVETLAGVPVNTQATVAATWDDGSACHAYISAQVTGGQSYRVLTATPSGSVLTVADLLAAVPGDIVRVECSAGLTATVSLRDLLESSTNRARLNNTDSYVLLSQGQHMLDLLAAQNVDTHERCEIQLRWYGGTLLWMDVAFYNGYADLNGMASRSFTAPMFLNGVQKEVRAITHFNRTEWHRAYWSSGGTLYVRQVASEIIASRAVSNYDLTEPPSSAFLDTVRQSTEPMDNGDHQDDLDDTGAQQGLGPMGRWDAACVTSNFDRRACNWALANADGGMAYNYSSIMDSATGEMLSISDRPTFTDQGDIGVGSGWTSGLSPYDAGNTGQPAAHNPSVGYFAYLITGQIAFLKALHGWASFLIFWTNSSSNHTYNARTVRQFYWGSARGVGWSYRTVGDAARFTPDWHYLKPYYKDVVNGNFLKDTAEQALDALGTVEGTGVFTSYRSFFHYFLHQAVARLVCDYGFETGRTWAERLSIYIAGLMGNTGEFNWCFGTAQDHAIASLDAGPKYTTFAQMQANLDNVPAYAQSLAAGSQALADAMEANGEIADNVAGTMTGHATVATGYTSNIRPCVAYLGELGIAGAADCVTQLNTGLQPDYSDTPQFNIVPRAV